MNIFQTLVFICFNLTSNLDSVNKSKFLTPVTDGELMQHVNNLKTDNSLGFDMITVELVQNMHQYLLAPLKHIYNLILKTGIVPPYILKNQ